MIITQKIGHLSIFQQSNQLIDWLPVEWFETNKRILHKQTEAGTAVSLQFLNTNPNLTQGDVLFANEETIIAIDIIPCEVILITPATIIEAASICYEIGNRHLPLYYDGNQLLIPYDVPLYRVLEAAGYKLAVGNKKLHHSIKTSVLPHQYTGGSGLLSKLIETNSTL